MQVRNVHREHKVKQNILIVDDSEISREILIHILGDEYTLYQAENGQQAIDILSENYRAFQLVLLDIHMPVLDGYGVLEIMKQRGWLKELPVIVISSDPGDAYKRGATDFFSKPFDPDVVNVRIHNIISLYDRYYTDNLTEGLNRKGFIRQSEIFFHGKKDKTGYDLMFFDIKDFKAVNELTGIANGDQVLRDFYNDLCDAQFAPILVARIEADHFVCLSEQPEEGYDFLNEICSRRYEKNGKTFQLNVHCGIYHLENKPMAISGMIDRARLAEGFSDSEYGRSYVVYDHTMKNVYIDNAELSSSLMRGLEQEEFKLFFQPIMDVKTEKIASAEALIRWQHPEKGMISPGMFIPVLEKDGYISNLDLYVVRKVKEFLTDRLNAGNLTVPVSVNLSRIDFYDEQMMQEILSILHSGQLPSGAINFEITESAYAVIEERSQAIVEEMRRCGAKILMDDFGTGYSSFGMLQDFDFDVLKIAMEFIHQVGRNPRTSAILRSIIELSHELGLNVVAEGVEKPEHVEFLRQSSCDFIQGYYYSRPVDADTFMVMLDQQKKQYEM